jgi:CTP synthase
MRLGAYPCRLKPGSRAAAAYGVEEIRERHRHRFEVNNLFRDRLAQAGLVMSGICPDNDLVEMIEVAEHPWFVGVQFHPELKSRPRKPHPLFREFVRASLESRERRLHAEEAVRG